MGQPLGQPAAARVFGRHSAEEGERHEEPRNLPVPTPLRSSACSWWIRRVGSYLVRGRIGRRWLRHQRIALGGRHPSRIGIS